MGLFPPQNVVEQEIERIKNEYPSQVNRIERVAQRVLSDFENRISANVCIAVLRKEFPGRDRHVRGRRSGSPKRRERRR